ncbi:hypothetical protein BaRGS_00024104 [Batillaria attramentaria]|uniref:Uncharacterized protein n=1 Tax=Batillaria attramentaria TaxID=370345 RepID=A0ABD0KC89_9CAEN
MPDHFLFRLDDHQPLSTALAIERPVSSPPLSRDRNARGSVTARHCLRTFRCATTTDSRRKETEGEDSTGVSKEGWSQPKHPACELTASIVAKIRSPRCSACTHKMVELMLDWVMFEKAEVGTYVDED